MCVSYSLLPHYEGCTTVFLPCSTDHESLWNAIHVQYTNGQEQNVCYDIVKGQCYSVAVFGMGKNGLLDSAPAHTSLKTIGNLLNLATKLDLLF